MPPPISLDRIPLPSLQCYTSFSILLFSCSVYYALRMTSTTELLVNPSDIPGATADSVGPVKTFLYRMLVSGILRHRVYAVISVLMDETFCMWTLINMVYCLMILIGKGIQRIVFGNLRTIEKKHIQDKFWNFVFYKFIFIFGVMNVQYMEEVQMWVGWFSVVGAFHLLSTLCKDRFEYLSFSPTTPKWTHLRLFSLLFFILGVSVSLCTIVGFYASVNIFFFLAAEWALVVIRTFFVFSRYIIHLYDIKHEGTWENRGKYSYYSELTYEFTSLFIDFFHHLHMLLWRNIFVSVASLVICMQLRCLISDIQHKYTRHKNYLKVTHHMESNYPLATREEIDKNTDDCAICWDRMESARKLPCGHMFHTSCLLSWLEQVTTCPTCRSSLVSKNRLGSNDRNRSPDEEGTLNHFFHFDGSRYASWLPSFSVEVSHSHRFGQFASFHGEVNHPRRTISQFSEELDQMTRQVLQMFPHVPYVVAYNDLRFTHSVEETVENILDGGLGEAPNVFQNDVNPGRDATDSAETTEPQPSTSHAQYAEPPPVPPSTGYRFSKSPKERQEMLVKRKEELILKARNKYIDQILTKPFTEVYPSTSSASDS